MIDTIVFALLTITAAAILNRIAGGGCNPWPTGEEGDWLLKRWLPGKPLIYIAAAMGLLAWCWIPVQFAAALAFAYFIWRLFEWGPYLPMDRKPWEPVRSQFDAAIRSVSLGSQRLAMFWRMEIGVAPAAGAILLFFNVCSFGRLLFSAGFAAALWLAYEAGWQGYDRQWWGSPNDGGVPAAEHIAGALWGALMVGVAL